VGDVLVHVDVDRVVVNEYLLDPKIHWVLVIEVAVMINDVMTR